MYLIAGLGNPGSKYELTRHNAGFLFLDYLADALHLVFGASKWKASAVQGSISGKRLLLFKPESYMNLSGEPLAAAASYYRIPADKVIVVHDDLDLAFGAVKVSVNRGAGGHKGVSSIIDHLGSKSFIRIRIGVGRPEGPIPIEKFVLLKMSDGERKALEQRFPLLTQAVEIIMEKGVSMAMNRLNETSGLCT